MESLSAARAASLLARSDCSACTWSSTFRTSPLRAQPATSPRASGATAKTLRPAKIVAPADDFELGAPVLRPGALVVAVHHGTLFAPRLRLDAAGIDAVAHQVLLGGLGAPVAEREVVLVGAALVAVAADADTEIRIGLQDGDLLIERAHVVRANARLIEVEVDHRREHVADFF